MTSSRFDVASCMTFASSYARRSSGTSSPWRSAAIRIESIPLFLPSTTPRVAHTISELRGSIAGGSVEPGGGCTRLKRYAASRESSTDNLCASNTTAATISSMLDSTRPVGPTTESAPMS